MIDIDARIAEQEAVIDDLFKASPIDIMALCAACHRLGWWKAVGDGRDIVMGIK